MSKYPKVKFGDFVEHIIREIELEADKDYHSVGVKWYGEGVHVHEVKSGGSFNAARFGIKENDIIYNDMWARNGSVAIVPSNLDGAVASSHFPTFLPDTSRVLSKYLQYYFKTPTFWNDCENASRGSTGRNQIKKSTFYAIEVPLPSIDDQRRIVEHIEALSTRIAKAQSLREEAEQEADALIESALNSIVQNLENKYETKFLEELIVEANYGTSVKCFSERESGSIPVLRIPNVASEKVTLNNLKYGSLSKPEFDKTVLKQGDILVVRTNGSADLVGRCAVVPELHEPMAFASYMIRIRCNQEVISSDFLQLVLRQQRTSGFLFDFARTSAGQYNVSLGRLKMTKIPIPPLDEQRRIVAYLDSVQARLAALRELQSETQEELDALLPSVLDRAFKGEL